MPPKQSKHFKPTPEQEAAKQVAQTSPQQPGAKKRRAFNIPKVSDNTALDLTSAPVLDATQVVPAATASTPAAAAQQQQPQQQQQSQQQQQQQQQSAGSTPPSKGPAAGPSETPAQKSAAPAAAVSPKQGTLSFGRPKAAEPKAAEPPLKAARVEPQAAPVEPQPVRPTGESPLSVSASPPKPAVSASPPKPAVSASPPKPQDSPQPQKAAPPAQPPVPDTTVAVSPAGKQSHLTLTGLVFCFTGELENMARQEVEDKVKSAGGKVNGACSGNVNFLVLGTRLEDGRKVEETSKYRKYMELKDKGKKCPELLTEEQLFAKLPKGAAPRATVTPVAQPPPAPEGSRQPRHTNWVDTYAPRGFGDLVGCASSVRKLTEWLRDWDNVCLRGNKKPVAFRPGGGMPDNVNAKAVLVSGPPGIGKTTSCRLVAQLHGGYEVLEFNASDARGQKIIQQMSEGIADNTTISFGRPLEKKVSGFTKRAVIIMDEVDGMGAGDRGGNAALIKMIKKTRNPIICICNDQQSQKIRSLAFSCYDVKFARPAKGQVAQRCAEISKREGLDVEPNALEELAESCGGDMRMILNQMQAISKQPQYQADGVRYNDMKGKLRELSKDQQTMLSPFDAAKKLLNASEASKLSLRDKMDMFFVDFSLVGMLAQENYLNTVKSRPADIEVLNRCAYSADLMTVGDIMNTTIVEKQDWSLLPDVGLMSTVYPLFVTNGFVAFPSFPQFLGKYSTMSRMKRLSLELQTHLRLSSTVSKRHLMTSGYCDLLYKRLMDPLLAKPDLNAGSNDAVNKTVHILDAYGLRKDHLQEHLTELRSHLGGEDLFKNGVDSKVKAAMTREFNNGSHAMKVVLPSSKRQKAEPQPGEDDDDAGAEAEGDAAEGSDDDGKSSLVKAKKPGAKAKGKAKAKAAAEGSPDDKPKAKARGRGKAKSKA